MAEPLSLTSTPAPAPSPQDEVDALVKKHHAEIERIRALSASAPDGTLDQQGEFEKHGIDPEALKIHYKDMLEKNKQLLNRAKVSNHRTNITGLAAFFATAATALWHREKIAPNNLILQGGIIAGLATTAGAVAANIASFVFNRKIRIESRAFTQEAGKVFERELAIGIENTERNKAAAKAQGGTVAPSAARKAPPRPREGFMAEALKEKAAQDQVINR